eukprot:CAMPEP_0170185898 /NCGR_PEP_ID=MMETSP0040_2-20121228/37773_1 /TAXON_ID=641309 /ORGANISM="Lotharella oceanica, Strain CCMP622" /LENGTH=95 /DNA_ID=CAMNT_0010432449 /DNA_START=343 /DNA_END=631 /DNA_ORIENTATION=-
MWARAKTDIPGITEPLPGTYDVAWFHARGALAYVHVINNLLILQLDGDGVPRVQERHVDAAAVLLSFTSTTFPGAIDRTGVPIGHSRSIAWFVAG